MKPSITPKTRRVVPLRKRLETSTIRADARIAPANAAPATVRPAMDENPESRPVPEISRVAIAAPRPAPPLTPMIWGSARGLRKTDCIWAPERARHAPEAIAVSTLGRRMLQTIEEAIPSPPNRPPSASAAPIPEPPSIRSHTESSRSAVAPAAVISLFLRFMAILTLTKIETSRDFCIFEE